MKKLLISLLGLVVMIAVGAIGYLYLNLNSLIKQGVEEFAPQYTQTEVSLGGASVSVFSGEGGLSDLVIGNPTGFKSKEAFRLGSMDVAIDTGTITSDTVVIKSLIISGPTINFETGGKAGSNLQQLVKNIQGSAKTAGSNAKTDQDAPSGDPKAEKKVIIDRLLIRDGRVAVSTPLTSEAINAELPAIELNGIGRKKGGETAGEVFKLVMEKVTASASSVAGVSVDELKKKARAEAKAKVDEKVGELKGKAADKLKGLFGN